MRRDSHAGRSARLTETAADRFHQEAEECRKLAENTRSQVDKAAWLSLAAD